MDDLKPITEMPQWRCHKLVRATKVLSVNFPNSHTSAFGLVTEFGEYCLPPRDGTTYEPGGYLVRYDDGYISYSPAKPFEEGYTLSGATSTKIVEIAKICHEANRAFCASLGDDSQVPWADAPEWQQNSAINGVAFHLANPEAGDSASHDNWMAVKVADGWVWGPVKDAEAKTHPCIIAFDLLPPEQKFKDTLFRAIVHAAF